MKATSLKKAMILLATSAMMALTAMPVAAATPNTGAQTVMATTKKVAIKSIALNKKTATLNVGKSETLKVTYNPVNTTTKTVTWKSSNGKVATVSKGKITAKAPGTTTITANCGGKTATCKLTVKAPLTKISLSKTSVSLLKGGTASLTVSYAPVNTTDKKTVTWTTSNKNVATVSGGKITAKGVGTATITAKVGSKTATCKVEVNAVKIPAASEGSFVNVNECYNTLTSYRKAAGAKALTKNTALENAAKTRAREIVFKFSHTRPNGQSGLSLISGNVYKGENIAYGQINCERVMKAWYNSAGHKANMLSKNYTKVGIAGFKYRGTIYWVQLFSS